jgi:hypothetical protein
VEAPTVRHARPSIRWSSVLLVAMLLTGLAGLRGPSLRPASANGYGALTVVASGGAAEGAGWSYDPATGVLTVGSDVAIAASELVSRLDVRDLTVIAQRITVEADVETTVASRSLVLKSQASITVDPGVRIATDGGDVVLWADASGDLSDASRAGGGIEIGVDQTRVGGATPCPSTPTPDVVEIVTNGGDIVLSGGAVADLEALRTDGVASFAAGLQRACSEYYFAIGLFGADLDARRAGDGGGDVIIRGDALDFDGLIWNVNIGGTYGGATTVRTSGSGRIDIFSTAASTSPNTVPTDGRNPWAIAATGTIETADGPITLTGTSNVARPNARGHSLSGVLQSSSGTIRVIDATENTSASNYNGPFINGARFGQGSLSSSSSDVEIVADKVFFNGSAQVSTSGTFTYRPQGTSILAVNNSPVNWIYPFPNLISTDIGALVIGKPGNTSGVVIGAAGATIPGPVTLYGDNIAIGGTLSTGATLALHAASSATQTASIAAADLRLFGAGTFTLQHESNLVGTVAGGTDVAPLGDLRLVDSADGLTIGSSEGDGIVATGSVDIATLVGDITLRTDISSADTGVDAVTVNAGRASAIGDETGGDVHIVGTPAVTTGAGGIVKLFSGSDPASTGLTAFAGGAVRSGVDETTATFDPELTSGGTFALYRSLDPVDGGGDGDGDGDGGGDGDGDGEGGEDGDGGGGGGGGEEAADTTGADADLVPARVNTGGGPVPIVPLPLALGMLVAGLSVLLVQRQRELVWAEAWLMRQRQLRALAGLHLPAFDLLQARLDDLRRSLTTSLSPAAAPARTPVIARPQAVARPPVAEPRADGFDALAQRLETFRRELLG